MRILKTLAAFKKYARRPKADPQRVATQAVCMILNTIKAQGERETRRVDALVREAVWSTHGNGFVRGKAAR